VNFTGKQMQIWDIRKPFQAACTRAGIKELRIHDLRHMATTILFLRGIPEAIIHKLTGHRSRELERYEHLSPGLKRQTVDSLQKSFLEKAQLLTHPVRTQARSICPPTCKIGRDTVFA
jgi:integrase